MTVEMTEDQFYELIARLAFVDATGETNGKPRLGISGAEEAFDIFCDFIEEISKGQA
jgi:hypothetical protein